MRSTSFAILLNENDSLLIYYAGHGYSDHAADKAYWLPVDADSIYSSNRIIADELTTDVRVQNARQSSLFPTAVTLAVSPVTPTSLQQSAGRMVFLNRMLKEQIANTYGERGGRTCI